MLPTFRVGLPSPEYPERQTQKSRFLSDSEFSQIGRKTVTVQRRDPQRRVCSAAWEPEADERVIIASTLRTFFLDLSRFLLTAL